MPAAVAVLLTAALLMAGCGGTTEDVLDGEERSEREERSEMGVPAAHPVLGFSPGAGLREEDDANVAGDLDAMVTLGAAWIRLDIDWSEIEAEPSRFDWSEPDRLIEAATTRGLEVLAMVAYSPPWARPDGTDEKAPPDDEQMFARFVAEAVTRYRPMGVRAWQVWNEPNSPLFWAGGADPDRYGSLLAATSASIRAVDPDAVIISGGLAPASDLDEGWLSPDRYLARLVDLGVLADVDGVGIHPYSFPALPLDPASAPWNTFLKLPELHRLLIESAAGPETLWITEYGAPTGTHERAVTEAEQAAMLTAALDAAATHPWLGPMFLYALRDFHLHPEDLEWNYGILRADGSPKQAWIVLANRRP